MDAPGRQVGEQIVRLLDRRDPASSICPSEVARALWAEDWRRHMDDMRAVTTQLVETGVVRATQGSGDVDPMEARGPIRVRRGPRFDGEEPS